MLRQRLLPALLAATPLLFAGCESAPNYSVEPVIEFKSIRAQRVTPTNGETAYNLIYVTVNYKDGDGDLGLSEEDRKNPPFNNTMPASYNEYYYNYYVTLYWFDGQRFQPYNSAISYNGAFPRLLTEADKPQPIRGELTYRPGGESGFTITEREFRPGTRLKFDIQVVDRALHKSNIITTDELVLP